MPRLRTMHVVSGEVARFGAGTGVRPSLSGRFASLLQIQLTSGRPHVLAGNSILHRVEKLHPVTRAATLCWQNCLKRFLSTLCGVI